MVEQQKNRWYRNNRQNKAGNDKLAGDRPVAAGPLGKNRNRRNRWNSRLQDDGEGQGIIRTNQDQQSEKYQGEKQILDANESKNFFNIQLAALGDTAAKIIINVTAQYQHEKRNGHGAD